MTWKFVTFGLALVIMVYGEKSYEADLLYITELRIPKSKDKLTICCTDNEEKYTSARLTAKDTTGNEGIVEELDTSTVTDENCFTFVISNLQVLLGITVEYTLEAINSELKKNNGFCYAEVKILNADDVQATVDVFGLDDSKMVLRVNGDLTSKVFMVGTEAISCPIADKPCYLMDIAEGSTDELSVCIEDIRKDTTTIGNEIKFCSADVTTNTGLTTVTGGASAVTLDHGSPTGVSLEATCTDVGTCIKAEMVIQQQGLAKNEVKSICELEALTGKSCELTSIKKDKTYIIFIAYLDKDSNALYYERKLIKNRNLVVEKLVAGVIEGTWSFSAVKQFQIERQPNPETSFNIADVDCTYLTDSCFVYFTGLTGKSGEYTLTLKPINNWNIPPVDFTTSPEHEKSATISIAKHSKVNDINIENIQVKQEVVNKMAKFDFNYNHDISNKTTQYEIILINDKGNWKKSVMKTTFDENQDYSTSIMFSLEQLDKDFGLMMLVVERDINSGKVVASGEKTLQVSALRAIKPAVDNGSEGSTSTLAIVGAAIGGIACLMALVAAAVMFVMKIKRDNDGLQYPLHRTNIEQDSSYIHGLDNPIPTM